MKQTKKNNAGKLFHEKYGNIYWPPCATHCLDLILKDIHSMPHVMKLAKKSPKEIIIYNRIIILH